MTFDYFDISPSLSMSNGGSFPTTLKIFVSENTKPYNHALGRLCRIVWSSRGCISLNHLTISSCTLWSNNPFFGGP